MSSTPDENERRTVVDHASSEQQRDDYYSRSEKLQEWIEECSRALSRGTRNHYWFVATRLRDDILPTLQDHVSRTFEEYDDALGGHPNWDWMALSAFIDAPDGYVRRLAPADEDGGSTEMNGQTNGTSGDTHQAAVVVNRAMESAAAIAEAEDIVLAEYTSRVDVVGFELKLGEHLQKPDMDIGDPVGGISEQSGALKTLFTGGTGQGKSAALEREAEDYYRRTIEDGRDFKLIDLIGIGDGENWFYDIPQQDDELRRVREELSLPGGLDELDHDPQLRIRVPLTPNLPEENLPFDTDSGRFVVEPFTIPASSIRKPLLVSLIVAKLTPQQENVVRDAYDEVSFHKEDWALKDLADEIRARDELDPNVKAQPIRTLRQLQRQGFIRTNACDLTLDWREVFESPETITVFSEAFLDDLIARLICIGYLMHTIIEERKGMYGIPECVLLMRELWKVTPHGEREAFDNRAAQLQDAIGTMLGQLFRENRHSGVHVLADTQYYDDLTKAVRTMFNRYAVFHTSTDNIKQIFDATASDRWRTFGNTISPDRGRASVVGMVEPALEEQYMDFIGPMEYAPPAHHHFMEQVDHAGWRARTRYIEHEKFRQPTSMGVDWPAEVPTKLRIGGRDTSESPDPETEPVKAFVEDCIDYGPTNSEQRTTVRTAFNSYARAHDRGTWNFEDDGVKQRFGTRLKSAVGKEIDRTTKDYEPAYANIALNSTGLQYLKETQEDVGGPV